MQLVMSTNAVDKWKIWSIFPQIEKLHFGVGRTFLISSILCIGWNEDKRFLWTSNLYVYMGYYLMCLKYESLLEYTSYFRKFRELNRCRTYYLKNSHAYVRHHEMYVRHQHTLMIYTTFRTDYYIMLVYVIKLNPSYNENWY